MHADVKPSNILVDANDHVTLIDLGFARRTTGGHTVRSLAGTVNYMAPEMAENPQAADIRADLYSLGVSAFELLSGRLPFAGRDAAEVLAQHRKQRPESLAQAAPSAPHELVLLVDRLLSKTPDARPRTARDVERRLTQLERERG